MTTPHPQWGHTFDSTPSYSLESLVDVAVDKELAGLLAMEKISRLATETPTSTGAELEQDIDPPTLESALRLALDPSTIRHLANPPVISGCIQLLKSAAKQRKGESPFSYEYGSLCFSIILFCFDICLLERFDMLDETLASRERTADVPVYVDTSLKLASILEDQFVILNRGGDCDWVFGWSTSPAHHQYPPILPRSDISDLMNVIWDDRWYILTVSRMSSLLFLLSRHVFHERISRHNPDGETLQLKLYELALRSLFAASPSHRVISMHIINTHEVSNKWTNAPKQIDAHDSRLIMSEYIKQFSDTRDPSFLLGNIPAMMLRLVAPVASAETQDLLPGTIRCTLIYAWTSLTVLEIRNEVVVFAKFLFDHLHTFMQPPPDSPYRLIPSVRKEIIRVFHDGELLDWVARALIRLDPNDPDSTARMLKSLGMAFSAISHAIPTKELNHSFQDYLPFWSRIRRHLLSTTYTQTHPFPLNQIQSQACARAWVHVAHTLGLDPEIHPGESRCWSVRCPGAYMPGAPRFGCVSGGGWYCDSRCQVADWKFGENGVGHERMCRPGF